MTPGAPGPFGSALDWLALVVWLLLVYWQPSVSFGSGRRSQARYAQYTNEPPLFADAPAAPDGGRRQPQPAPPPPVRAPRSTGDVLFRLLLSPPGWLFGIVWTLLYALMAVAGFVYWRRGSADDPAQRLELRVTTLVAVLVNLVLNKLWTPLYFDANQRALALVVALGILATNVWVLVEFFTQPDDAAQAAGYLWLPYTLWSAYAVLLNAVRVGRRRTLV